jgi:hypothetical protein
MRLLKSGSFFVIFLIVCFQGWSQQVINNVNLQKISPELFKVLYKLNNSPDYEMKNVVLKILRRRDGTVEEIFSKDVTPDTSGLKQVQTYQYNWKPATGFIKEGDELQAKIVLSYRSSIAKQDPKVLNKTPHADAGDFLDLQLPLTRPVVLNGSKSHDDDGKIVAVQWKQMAGPTNLSVLKNDSLVAYATGQFEAGSYAFELSVKDDRGATAVSRTILRVKSASIAINAAPITPVQKKDTPTVQVVELPQATTKTVARLKGGPTNAAINLLLPGVGHYFVSGNYKGESRKKGAFILTAVYAGSIGGAVYFNTKSNRDYKKYDDLANYREYQKDASGLIIGIRGAKEADANRYFNNAKTAHRNSLICIAAGGGVLVGDLVYTFLKGRKNQREWKTKSTSFKPRLIFSSNGAVTTAGVQFKF